MELFFDFIQTLVGIDTLVVTVKKNVRSHKDALNSKWKEVPLTLSGSQISYILILAVNF